MTDLKGQHRNRTTGTRVGIYDAHHPNSVFDPDGGRWVTVCEDHGMLVNHATLALARRHAARPDGWCEPCQKKVDQDMLSRVINPTFQQMREGK